MKKHMIIAITLFLICSINTAFASSYILPSGGKDGSYWRPASNQHISWSKFFLDTTKNLDIYLWNADNSTFTLIGSNIISTSESYVWYVPNNQALGENFKIKLTYANDTSTNFSLLSDDFFPISNDSKPTLSSVQIFTLNSGYTLQVNPIPASDVITVSSDNQFFHIDIYNYVGGLVFNSNNFEYTLEKNIDVSNLPDGVYSVKVKFLGSEATKQLVISR